MTVVQTTSVLFNYLESSKQRHLLDEMVERAVVDGNGKINRVELKPPFAYLHNILCWQNGDVAGADNAKTSNDGGQCSIYLSLDTPDDSSVKPFFEEATSLVPSKLSLVKFPQKFLLQQILHKYL